LGVAGVTEMPVSELEGSSSRLRKSGDCMADNFHLLRVRVQVFCSQENQSKKVCQKKFLEKHAAYLGK
jgi:hypothetical protein